MNIKDKDITFVVQGPIQASKEREQISGITEQCLASIRHYFPESKIILSTWKNQDYSGLDYDQLLELDDPGSNDIFQDDQKVTLNNNRQIYSTHQGLKAVRTKYAVKLRTDNKLTSRKFVELYETYSKLIRNEKFSFFNSRVVTSSTFFLTSHSGQKVHFHKSDIFDFGETSDLLKIWREDFIPKLHFSKVQGYKSRYPATEQFLSLNWLSKLVGKSLHINNKSGDDAGLGENFWDMFVANNLIVDAPEKIGLDVTDRFYDRGNLSLELDLTDWKQLNCIEKRTWDRKKIIKNNKSY